MKNILIAVLLVLIPSRWCAAETPDDLRPAAASGTFREDVMRIIEARPTPPFVAVKFAAGRFVPTAELIARLLATPPRAMILNDVDELKFLPHTLSRSSLLLVLHDAKGWTEERAKKVMAVSRLNELPISLVWLSADAPPPSLIDVVHGSGGRSLDRSEVLRRVEAYARDNAL